MAANPIVTGVDCDISLMTDVVMKWDMFASETGLYRIEGCDGASPKLHVSKGQAIRFHQSDDSNWYHPVGFAYEPGGAHNDCGDGSGECPELGGEDGGSTLQYNVDGAPVVDDESGFGLDAYEPLFFYPFGDWKEMAAGFTVDLVVPDVTSYYYFCHIHAKMSAEIVVIDATAAAPSPTRHGDFFVPPPVISDFDNDCGTVAVSEYVHHDSCAGKHFLCGDNLDSTFNQCMEAIDCKMHHQMAVKTDTDKKMTFFRQMIPHHVNAVNMAKILFKEGDLTEGDDEIKQLLTDIINTQNHQIQTMEGYLQESMMGSGHDTHCYDSGAEPDKCPPGCMHSSMNRRLLFASAPCAGVPGCVMA